MTLENHRDNDQGRLFSSLFLIDSGSFFLFLACALMTSFLPERSPSYHSSSHFLVPAWLRIFCISLRRSWLDRAEMEQSVPNPSISWPAIPATMPPSTDQFKSAMLIVNPSV
jgi:hypothetical protein